MEDKLFSAGKCIYCEQLIEQNAILKHLAKHFSDLEKEKTSKNERVYHLNIYSGEMFLQVLVKGSASFKALDTFLRNIWVDCCDHLSDFRHKNFNIRKSDKFEMILTPKLKLEYHYDYGSTTAFYVQVCGSYSISQKENVLLVSRNEPLKIVCRLCNRKPATSICTVHMYETNECFFCDDCAIKHEEECEDFLDYAQMPVVNSPRMGVCGYAGGHIDKDRDGAYAGRI